MYLTSVLVTAFALMVHVTVGFVIPDGQAPGVYEVHVLGDGTDHHVKVVDTPTNVSENYTVSLETFNASDIYDWWVECLHPTAHDHELQHPHADAAIAGIDAWCGDGRVVHKGYHIYAISDCVVAYYCHDLGHNNKDDSSCSKQGREESSLQISEQCRPYWPGIRRRIVGQLLNVYTEAYGYEYYCTKAGHDFCGGGVDGANSGPQRT